MTEEKAFTLWPAGAGDVDQLDSGIRLIDGGWDIAKAIGQKDKQRGIVFQGITVYRYDLIVKDAFF